MFKAFEFETNKKEVLIGIIGDTHFRTAPSFRLKGGGGGYQKALKIFKDNKVDLIIHAGDISVLEGLKDLEKIAPVFAVWGNNDLPEIEQNYPAMLLLKIFNWKIGVLHNLTSLIGFFLGRETEKAKELIKKHKFDIIISGHIHRPYIKKVNNTLLINPGSATQPFFSRPAVVILKINKNSYNAKIIHLEVRPLSD